MGKKRPLTSTVDIERERKKYLESLDSTFNKLKDSGKLDGYLQIIQKSVDRYNSNNPDDNPEDNPEIKKLQKQVTAKKVNDTNINIINQPSFTEGFFESYDSRDVKKDHITGKLYVEEADLTQINPLAKTSSMLYQTKRRDITDEEYLKLVDKDAKKLQKSGGSKLRFGLDKVVGSLPYSIIDMVGNIGSLARSAISWGLATVDTQDMEKAAKKRHIWEDTVDYLFDNVLGGHINKFFEGAAKDKKFSDETNRKVVERLYELNDEKIQRISDVLDETYNENTVEINGEDYPIDKHNEGTGKTIYEVETLQKDDDGNYILDENGKPVYDLKYSLAEQIFGFNKKIFTDPGFLLIEGTQGVESAFGFIAGGIGVGKGLSIVGKATTKLGKANKLISRGKEYINKTLKINKKFSKYVPKSSSVNKAINTVAHSYIMTNLESQTIGRQVSENVLNKNIDQGAEIDKKKLRKVAEKEHPDASNSQINFYTNRKVEKLRFDFAKNPENRELMYEYTARSDYAGSQGRAVNNYNMLLNLTTSGLFLKGRSLSRNILKNPLTPKRVGLGALAVMGEMGQEAIEEGVINLYAEKFGEKAGEFDYYTLKDFYKNDVGRSEFIDSAIMGALMGGLQTMGIRGINTPRKYSEYKKQKKVVDDLVKYSSLSPKLAEETINISTDKAVVDGYFKKMEESENLDELYILANKLIINKALSSAFTGTSGKLIEALDEISKHEEITEEEIADINAAKNIVNNVADTYDKHYGYLNRREIMYNRVYKELYQDKINSYEEESSGIAEAYENKLSVFSPIRDLYKIKENFIAKGVELKESRHKNY